MRLLIIGAKGQLGQDCVKLFGKDNTLRCVDIPDIDITDMSSVRANVECFKPDAIINCAAYTRVDAAESDEACCRKINTDGPSNIAAVCEGSHIKLVHISTDYVFDGCKPLFETYTENDAVNPVSVYGRTKLDGEKPVLTYDHGAVLRTAWLYGAYGNNFLKTMLKLSMRVPDSDIRVVADQHGSPTCSASLACQIKKLLDNFNPGLYHATAQGHCTWYDLTVRFFSKAGIKTRVIPISTAEYPTPARRPTNSILENRKLKLEGLDLMPEWETDVDFFAENIVPIWREELLASVK